MEGIGVANTNYVSYLIFLSFGLLLAFTHDVLVRQNVLLKWIAKFLTGFELIHVFEISRCVHNILNADHPVILPFYVFILFNVYGSACIGLILMYHSARLRRILVRLSDETSTLKAEQAVQQSTPIPTLLE